jgi:hypothetical protein
MKFIDYIHDVMKHGRCSFTLEHAQKTLQKSKGAILASIKHMLVKTEIANPVRGFYVIVPPEYQKLECLPVEYFIPYLMEYLNLKYYVCLLSAALYHGASHQAIQVFQVMVEKPRRPIVCGKIRINFIGNRQLSETPVQTIANTKCIFTVSTPEGTAMDLLKYPDQSAGFNHIATVMAELCDVINPEKLVELLKQKTLENSWKQRLGYVLELVEKPGLASLVKAYLDKQKRIDYVYMQPVKSRIKNDSYPRNNKWKIIENIKIESDL